MIKYRKGYKYQLADTYIRKIDIIGYNINTEFILLNKKGFLTIKNGFAWDGASGPTIDTDNSMEGGLVHDALYQLLRQDFLPQIHRKYADKLLKDICVSKGMWKFRANIWEDSVQKFAKFASSPKNKKEVYIIK